MMRRIRFTPLTDFRSWLGNWWELVGICLVFVTLEIAVLSLEQVEWIKPQPSLSLVLALAVLAGLFSVKIKLPSILKWCFIIIIGIGITIWQASNLFLITETSSRISQLIIAVQSWWKVTSITQPSEGTIHISIFLIFFTWMLGYVSTWFVLIKKNAWIVVTLGAVTILINMGNLPSKYYSFFFFYLLAAMLLIGQTSLAKRYSHSAQNSNNLTNSGLAYFIASVFLLSILATSIAWFTPEIRFSRLESAISTKIPGRSAIEKFLTNIFAAVPRKQPFLKADEQDELFLGDVFERINKNDLHFIIKSENPHYWRTRIYDVYTSVGWRNSRITDRIPAQQGISAEGEISVVRSEVSYSVTTQLKTDIILTTGEFVSSDTPALLQILDPLNSEVNQEEIRANNIISITTPYPLKTQTRYTVTINTVNAAPDKLSKAGDNYPSWITDYYLQLPDSLPERIRKLSEEVTKEAKNPYDKLLAIKEYMAQFSYNPETEPLSEEVCGVDHFLFVKQSGNCVHFASTMTIMLRTVGVPARFCIGYLPGEWDEDIKSYIVRARHYHAWPEVYFPSYGWIQFESITNTDNAGVIIGDGTMKESGLWEWEELVDTPVGGNDVDTPSVATTSPKSFWPIPIALLSGIILLLVLMYIIYALRSASSRRVWYLEGSNYVSEVYDRMCNLAALAKLGPRPQQTPLEYGNCLAIEFPQQASAIKFIINSYLENQFGHRKELGLTFQAELMKSRLDVYNALLERLHRKRHGL